MSHLQVNGTSPHASVQAARLVPLLRAIHAATPISSFSMSPVANAARKFLLRLDAADARTWRHVVDVGARPPTLTFTITGTWTVDDASRHRLLRDLAIELLTRHGVTSLTYSP